MGGHGKGEHEVRTCGQERLQKETDIWPGYLRKNVGRGHARKKDLAELKLGGTSIPGTDREWHFLESDVAALGKTRT